MECENNPDDSNQILLKRSGEYVKVIINSIS